MMIRVRLKNMSFKINPNETIGIVGKSGQGKTTIFNLISKLYSEEVSVFKISFSPKITGTFSISLGAISVVPILVDLIFSSAFLSETIISSKLKSDLLS